MDSVSSGAVCGSVRWWLRAEGFSVLALSLLCYRNTGLSWWIFLALLLVPDLCMAGYLIHPKAGAACYNVVHSYVFPLSFVTLAVAFHRLAMLPYLFIWMAHLGMDRTVGYGLKYPTGFQRTHLGDLTRNRPVAPTIKQI